MAPHGCLVTVVVGASASPHIVFVVVACLLLDFGPLVANGCWQRHKVDNKYLQETMSPLISVKKLSALESPSGRRLGVYRTHKMPARKQFIKVLLLNCRPCGVGSESFAVCRLFARVSCLSACWLAYRQI